MNPFLWFQRLFVPSEDSEDSKGVHGLDNESSFVFAQHLRIVLAIVICVLSAFVIWWIMI